LSSPNDTIYSMVGIYSSLQKLADSYVLLGELRGDLLDVTPNSNQDLREINDFNISSTNPYANIKDYYAVINNCNYVINYLDTAKIIKGEKVMYRYYAAAKGIRAWTYMQIALNYGSAKYYDKPILSLADAQADYPEYNMTDLAAVLIQDLLPWKDEKVPDFFGSSMTFPIRFLLGDLYLWTNQYKEAATEYHDLMTNYSPDYYILIQKAYSSDWLLVNNLISTTPKEQYWNYSYSVNSVESLAAILCPTTYGQRFDLDSLNLKYELTPSAVALNNWDSQTYFNTITNTTPGDMRKLESVINRNTIYSFTPNSLITTNNPTNSTVENIVYKYLQNEQAVNVQVVGVYRASLLYLRYAEAVNRLGKPNLAFAVLKYGLKSTTLNSTKALPLNERSTDTYMNFSNFRFDNNVGIRSRGLGPNLGDLNPLVGDTNYIIPHQNQLIDSVLYVEDLIQKELALETAFEGNRFQDLMRIAIRRDDNSYLANIVSEKYTDNKEAIKSKLMIRSNWYIKQ
ncbi:MAG: RagB/SusD family nutrient uptake outer membrane protein, partial [Paludibacter sp.]|nr:RagB/SusD family nutrient uptake outer membrane protein [Paludibacter sp.]